MKTLQSWMQEHNAEDRKQLATLCNTTVEYLYQLAGGHRKPSLKLALLLQEHTSNEVLPQSFSDKEVA